MVFCLSNGTIIPWAAAGNRCDANDGGSTYPRLRRWLAEAERAADACSATMSSSFSSSGSSSTGTAPLTSFSTIASISLSLFLSDPLLLGSLRSRVSITSN